jgi:hypothetical protein
MLKKILSVITLSLGLTTVAFADEGSIVISSGPYLGAEIGAAVMNYKSEDYVKSHDSKVERSKLAGRGYAGYAFGQHLGMELGYTYYGQPTFKDNTTGVKENFTQYGVDLVGVANLTFDYGFGFYGKIGPTWVYRSAMTTNTIFAGQDANGKLTWLAGLGATYSFTPHLAANLGWARVFSNGDLPKTDLYTAGFIFRFKP